MRIQRIAVLSLLAVILTACSFSASVGAKAISTDKLEKQVSTKASEQQLTPSSVTCKDNLKAKVGAKAKCTLIANDLKYVATVTATKVKDDVVDYDMKIPPPAIVPTNSLEAQVAKLISNQVESGIDSVTCPDELEGTVGKTVDCAILAENGKKFNVAVTVTKADFFGVNFDINEK
ncbi:MAG: hypothetical protein JWQ70_1411 [Aeromicrobium sp.]|nr:hypothetical protein [Aeromicrobium sp.]